jgi:hypothetical protein
MFRHPASARRGYGVYEPTRKYHVLSNGDVWVYTDGEKKYAMMVYSARLGRGVLPEDNYPIYSGEVMLTGLTAATVDSFFDKQGAKAKADALFAPPAPVAAPVVEEAFKPSTPEQQEAVEKPATLFGIELTPTNLALAALAAVGVSSLVRRKPASAAA